MLEFFDEKEKNGVATIYDRHILFNSKLIQYFKDAYRVRAAIDKEEKKLYIFMINKDYALRGELNESSLLSVSVSKSYVRIASKSLINFIASSFNIETTKDKGIPFEAIYSDEKNAIIVNMGGSLCKNT